MYHMPWGWNIWFVSESIQNGSESNEYICHNSDAFLSLIKAGKYFIGQFSNGVQACYLPSRGGPIRPYFWPSVSVLGPVNKKINNLNLYPHKKKRPSMTSRTCHRVFLHIIGWVPSTCRGVTLGRVFLCGSKFILLLSQSNDSFPLVI